MSTRTRPNPVRDSRGFTLVELMIVVVILGVLAAIAIPNYVRSQRNARVGRTAAEMRSLANGFFGYLAAHGQWPPDSHRTLPEGMSEFIKPRLWAEETPIGGFYNWEGPDNYPFAGLSIFSCPAPAEEIEMLDELLDDGDLATGHFRMNAGRPTLIIEE